MKVLPLGGAYLVDLLNVSVCSLAERAKAARLWSIAICPWLKLSLVDVAEVGKKLLKSACVHC